MVETILWTHSMELETFLQNCGVFSLLMPAYEISDEAGVSSQSSSPRFWKRARRCAFYKCSIQRVGLLP